MLPSKKYRAKGILAELLFAWVIQSVRATYALLGTKECPGVPAGKERPQVPVDMKKGEAPWGVLAFVTGGDVIRVPWN